MIIKTREEEILQHIKENTGCTKTDVILYMENRGISSPAVTHKIIKRLEKDAKIIVRHDKSNSQKHRLYINNKNEFIVLTNKIDYEQARCNKLTKYASWRLYVKKRFKNTKSFDSLKQHYLNLLHFAQLTSYSEITSIAKRIDKNIWSRDDQETLYLRLTTVLNVSDKLNEILSPQVQLELEKLLDNMKNEQAPGKGLIMANMTKEIASLYASQG